jgi:hypothetical protein
MYGRSPRVSSLSVFILALFVCAAPVLAQQYPHIHPGSPFKPRVKLIGFLNTPIAETETRPVLTIALPGDDKRYTFLLADMKILAGPLRTPGAILDEVKPFSTNFYLRASQEVVAQISSAAPTEQLAIFAEYSSGDRVLLVQAVEKGEEAQNKEPSQSK